VIGASLAPKHSLWWQTSRLRVVSIRFKQPARLRRGFGMGTTAASTAQRPLHLSA